MYFYLSHVLSPSGPVYPGNAPLKVRRQYSFEQGDPFNQCEFEMCNHIGTHLDLPAHFNPKGKTAEQIDPAEWVFHSPVMLDIPKNDREFITADDLQAAGSHIATADLLLIRTGFEAHRVDSTRYVTYNPALHPSFGEYVMKHLPRLRAVGVDVVSAGNCNHISEAIAVHRILLGYPEASNRYVLIIEDMALQKSPSSLKEVVVLPLIIEAMDGVPCTVLASSENQ
jgi:kynurenine formamidase